MCLWLPSRHSCLNTSLMNHLLASHDVPPYQRTRLTRTQLAWFVMVVFALNIRLKCMLMYSFTCVSQQTQDVISIPLTLDVLFVRANTQMRIAVKKMEYEALWPAEEEVCSIITSLFVRMVAVILSRITTALISLPYYCNVSLRCDDLLGHVHASTQSGPRLRLSTASSFT